MLVTRMRHHSERKTADFQEPIRTRYPAAGPQTRNVPTTGTSEAKAIMLPQNRAGRPTSSRPIPPTKP